MLLCLIGPPCSGKSTLADWLTTHSFQRIHISSSAPPPPPPLDAPPNSHLHFNSSSDFLDHATRYWRRDYVTTDLTNKLKLQEFAKRPFTAIVHLDAPTGTRFRRAVERAQDAGTPPPSLADFVAADDLRYHGVLADPSLASSTSSEGADESAPLAKGVSRLNLAPTSSSSSSAASTSTATPPRPAQTRLSPTSEAPPSPSPSPYRLTPKPSPELSRSSLPHPPAAEDTLTSLLPLSHLTLSNPFPTVLPLFSAFHAALPALADLLRPSWDSYFMLLASLASLRSNCMKRRVGAVLVRDKRVVSTGYNGTPRGVKNCGEGGCGRCNSHTDGLGSADADAEREGGKEGGFSRSGEALDECLCLHAEENALLEAGRERVSGGGTEGAVLYCNTCPCLRCTVKIVQCGVREVVYSLSYSMDSASRRVMNEAGVGLRQVDMPAFPR
ncbi:hypothetical protein JCM8097_008641 [Rhodosporidiobolus ruineniae]